MANYGRRLHIEQHHVEAAIRAGYLVGALIVLVGLTLWGFGVIPFLSGATTLVVIGAGIAVGARFVQEQPPL